MQYKLDVNDIKMRCQGRWGEIFTALADPSTMDAWNRRGRHGACPIHGGNDGFRFFRDAETTGGCICATCGSFPDGLALLAALTDKPFYVVLKEVSDFLGGVQVSPAPPRRLPSLEEKLALEAKANRRSLEKTMKALKPLYGKGNARVAAYLASRGLFPELSTCKDLYFGILPYHKKTDAGFEHVGDFPCMVWLLRDQKGDVVSAHRTFLDPRGEGKLPGLPARKLFGSIKPKLLGGSAIRIGVPVDGVIGIAEGVETAMAVTQLTGEACWSALNTTLLEQFQVPEGLGITAVNIYADKDRSEAGQRAGKILARRLHAEGYKVEYRLPVGEIEEGTKSLDFADLALARRR
jgi:phage/plasmid primase-like uncharacterized protein